MASEYKKQGGGYTTDKDQGQDESQKNLSKWGEEDWQTKEGSGNAKKADGTQKRYLPKKAWEQMDEKEKEETDEKKQDASSKGQQHVGNTGKAKNARENVNKEENEQFEAKKGQQAKGGKPSKDTKSKSQANGSAPRRSGRAAAKETEKKHETAAEKDNKAADAGTAADESDFEDPGKDDDVAQEHPDGKNEDPDSKDSTMDAPNVEGSKAGQKRGRQTKKAEEPSKKQKGNDGASKKKGTIGSKHDSAEEPSPAASADRLPKKGQRVSWKALPGWVHGECTEVLTSEKEVDGKKVKASKSDPRIVMKSDNGKTAVHKVGAVHFDD